MIHCYTLKSTICRHNEDLWMRTVGQYGICHCCHHGSRFKPNPWMDKGSRLGRVNFKFLYQKVMDLYNFLSAFTWFLFPNKVHLQYFIIPVNCQDMLMQHVTSLFFSHAMSPCPLDTITLTICWNLTLIANKWSCNITCQWISNYLTMLKKSIIYLPDGILL